MYSIDVVTTTNCWTNFVAEVKTAHRHCDSIDYNTLLQSELARLNGKNVPFSPLVEFDTEEDAIVFKLLYG